MSDGLLTDEARTWIGMELDIECIPLTLADVQRFRVGIGLPPPADRRPPVGEGRGMNGESQLEFHRPLRLGDHLHSRRRLVSLDPKEGRRRSMVIATWL